MHAQDEVSTWIRSLAARQRPGHTLERAFYTDPRIFEVDVERVLMPGWIIAGHLSQLPRAGDWFSVEAFGESAILVRGDDGEVRGFLNVCRHRGSRLCTGRAGRSPRLVCPYHAWVYANDGRLIHARRMHGDFDATQHGLTPVGIFVLEGIIFVSFGAAPIDHHVAREHLSMFLEPHDLARTRVAARRSYHASANWKVVIENWLECYHCEPAHPEYCRVHEDDHLPGEPGYDAAAERYRRWEAAVRADSLPFGYYDSRPVPDAPAAQGYAAQRSPLRPGFATASEDGRPLGPLLGRFAAHDGGETSWELSPLSYGVAHADHAVLFRFAPKSTLETDIELTWLVAEEAVEGADYDVERLVWLWDATFARDRLLVDRNQEGVSSRRYQPGPYAREEAILARWNAWYLARVSGEGSPITTRDAR